MATLQQHIFPPKPKGKITTPLNKETAATTPLSPKRGPEMDQDDNALVKPKRKKADDAGSI